MPGKLLLQRHGFESAVFIIRGAGRYVKRRLAVNQTPAPGKRPENYRCFANNIFAYIMSSGNYRIQADDSLTTSGGAASTVNYIYMDTLGEFSTGRSDSDSYKMRSGYQEMLE